MEKGATLTLSLPCNTNKKLPMLLERNENGGVLHNGMSLFQDLKLKRRKVDSRCSSDGESIGTSESTSSLSPDAQPTNGEGSPKAEKERCLTPEELVAPCTGPKGNGGFSPQFYFMMKNDKATNNNNNYDAIKGLKSTTTVTTTANVVVVKSEPGEESSPSSSPGLEEQARKSGIKRREPSPNQYNKDGKSPNRMMMTNGGGPGPIKNGATGDSESVVSVKCEKMMMNEDEKEKMETEYEIRNGSGSLSQRSHHPALSSLNGSRGSPPRPNGTNGTNTSTTTPSPRRSPPQNMNNPGLIITKAKGESSYSQRSSPMSHHSGSSRGGSPPHLLNLNSHYLPPHLGMVLSGHGPPPPSGLFHATQLHARLTENRREGSPSMSHEKSDPPLSVVTSTSLSFHQSSLYRINGVRPEVISGGAVTPGASPTVNGGGRGSPPSSGNHHLHPHPHPLLPNGLSPQQHLHHHSIALHNGLNHHLPFPIQGNRKSPNSQNSQLSRSPNSSPSNSSNSSGSIQHSPGSGGGTIIAGGNIGMPNSSTTQPNSPHHVNLSRTPTVIMGEAGGVRTMLWSQPGQPLANPGLEIGIGGSSPPGSGTSPSLSSGASSNGSICNGGSSNGATHPAIQKGVLSMERLWASEALNLSTGASNTTNGHGPSITSLTNGHTNNAEDDEYEQPMICMICEDRATGLHYGIITCEGCKGFFKRTVQNRRVYTCVADGTCIITKAQRNRCQYCRFKKCIEQGMVLQAVREDRMPGGRNSGAVYNLYKVPVKYRKHKKGNRGAGKGDKNINSNSNTSSSNPSPNPNNSNGNSNHSPSGMLPPHPGNILMAALTSPTEGIPRRQNMPFEQAANMINSLVQCDNFHDIAALHNWEELLEARGDLSEKLCQMGDSIVYRLVQWTKKLPFYAELPVEVHTRVLTHKWHELLVLTTSAWQAMHSPAPPAGVNAEEETLENLQVLQRCLQAMMGRSLTLEQLKQDVGQMVERLTVLTRTFRKLGIRLEEYVTLKVIAMLQNTGTKSAEVTQIQERYIKVLRTFLEMTVPSQPNRLTELLRCLPEVQAAASLLLESKMFYVPFLLNSALLQR